MDEPFQPKLIYLARRHPSFARNAWTARWRRHGALGMSLPRWKNVARYVHCDVLEPSPAQRAYLSDHDGVGLIWHRSLAHRDAHFADTSSQTVMEQDEAETFAGWIADRCLSAREEVFVPPPEGGVKLVCFLWNVPGMVTPARACGHVRNTPLPPVREGGWGLDCDLVEEFWFANPEDADAAARDMRLAAPSLAVLCREVELYRAGLPASEHDDR